MPTAYYNEIDPFAAEWLRQLITAGHIAPGDVDERNIEEVTPNDLKGYTQCHFFAGIGVWSYSLRRAYWRDDRPVWTGSCPCQPFSAAGKKAGLADERNLWPAWFHLIAQCRPASVFGEQVERAINYGWLDLVQDDLEGIDYAVGAATFPACSVGAPHLRQRLYFVAVGTLANSHTDRKRTRPRDSESGGAPDQFVGSGTANFWSNAVWLPCRDGKYRPTEPTIFPLAHGIAGRVGMVRGAGNAIVAQQAEAFIKSYLEIE